MINGVEAKPKEGKYLLHRDRKPKQLTIRRNGYKDENLSSSRDNEIAGDIFAVDTPTAEDLSQTISKGIISRIRTIDGNAKIIQTDASINSGNSGGAIINKEGLVQGVVSSKLLGYGIEGVAFGIPAYEIYDRLKIRME